METAEDISAVYGHKALELINRHRDATRAAHQLEWHGPMHRLAFAHLNHVESEIPSKLMQYVIDVRKDVTLIAVREAKVKTDSLLTAV